MTAPATPLDETTPYAPATWGEGAGNPLAELRAIRFQHVEDGLGLADARARAALARATATSTRLDGVADDLSHYTHDGGLL